MRRVLYITSLSESQSHRPAVEAALEKSSSRQGFVSSTIAFDGTRDGMVKVIAHIKASSPNAIVISSDISSHFAELRVPIFDIGRVFKHIDDVKVFTQPGTNSSGDAWGLQINSKNEFHKFGDKPWKWGWSAPEDTSKWFDGLLHGKQGGSPHGHLGGRYSSNASDAAIALFCAAIGTGATTPLGGAAVGVVCTFVVKEIRDWVSSLSTPVDNAEEKQSSPKDAGPSGGVTQATSGGSDDDESGSDDDESSSEGDDIGQELDDVSGMDFMILLNEWASKQTRAESWKKLKEGKLSPEETDVRQEFNTWLQQTYGLNVPDEAMNSKDDETGHSFLYWLYNETSGLSSQSPSKFLQYWWSRGGPIDPFAYARSLVVQVLVQRPYLTGRIESDGALNLRFALLEKATLML